MPSQSKTSTMSPVVVAPRERLLPRVLAVAAFGVFVAGMLVAAGLDEQVLAALPFVGVGVTALVAVWGVWRLRPWRLAGLAGRGVVRGTRALRRGSAAGTRGLARTALAAKAVATRGVARGARASRAVAVLTVHASLAAGRLSGRIARRAGRGAHMTSTRLYAFATRPREPWRLPPGLVVRATRARCAVGTLIDRTVPLRCRADLAWRRFATAAIERSSAVANGRMRDGLRLLERVGR